MSILTTNYVSVILSLGSAYELRTLHFNEIVYKEQFKRSVVLYWVYSLKIRGETTRHYSSYRLVKEQTNKSNILKSYKIDFKPHEMELKRLQNQLLLALRAGNSQLVKEAVSNILSSHSARIMAAKLIFIRKGANSAGIDGEKWTESHHLDKGIRLILDFNPKLYKAKAVLRHYIPKRHSLKLRPLGIPTLYDRIVQQLYFFPLQTIAEVKGDESSFGFRQNRNTISLIYNLVMDIDNGKHLYLYDTDISGFYNNISHKWLIDNINMDKSVLHSMLKAPISENKVLTKSDVGIPQGGIISPIMANLTLDGLDKIMQPFSAKPYRFGDDVSIQVVTEDQLNKEIRPLYVKFLKERGLSLNDDKTKAFALVEGASWDTLGFTITIVKAGEGLGGGRCAVVPKEIGLRNMVRTLSELLHDMIAEENRIRIKFKEEPLLRSDIKFHDPIDAFVNLYKDRFSIMLSGWLNSYCGVLTEKAFYSMSAQLCEYYEKEGVPLLITKEFPDPLKYKEQLLVKSPLHSALWIRLDKLDKHKKLLAFKLSNKGD